MTHLLKLLLKNDFVKLANREQYKMTYVILLLLLGVLLIIVLGAGNVRIYVIIMIIIIYNNIVADKIQ